MDFFNFDNYIVSRMLQLPSDKVINLTEEQREEAYQIFLEKTGQEKVASAQTIKKWFGIGGYSKPNRENMIRLFFALGLSGDEAREWMVKGALEPDFQVNDFCELIYLYGLKKHLSYQKCQEMIETFISHLSVDMEIHQHNNTNEIWHSYGEKNYLEPDEFLEWMYTIKEELKGYSMTVLNYFKDLKTEILREVQWEARKDLDLLLAETGFIRMETERKLPYINRKKAIQRYLRRCESGKGDNISQDLIKCIRELLPMAELSLDSGTIFLSELFSYKNGGNGRRNKNDIRIMDDKYLSEILNISLQKERELKMLINGADKSALKEQKKRCRLIGRQELLPLILCVSQKRYLREHGDIDYNYVEARQQFETFANRILVACNMQPLQVDKLELDTLLSRCYEEDEMVEFSEMVARYYN